MGSPVASVEIQAKSAGLSAQLREARAKFGAFADGTAQLFIDAANKQKKKGLFGIGGKKGIGDMIGVAGGNLMASGVQKVTSVLEDSAKSAFTYQEKLTRLQILANDTPASMEAFSGSVKNASEITGKSKEEILDAASAYVALTGDMNVARASTLTWAKVAQATNSTVSDISQTAAAMSQNMKIGPEEMEAVFSSLNVQGKLGAIELKDLASHLSTIAPQWAMFGSGTGVKGVRDLGAALQIVKRGFGGDAGETVTGLQGLLTALVKNAARFEGAGVKGLFHTDKNGKKELNDVFSIVSAIGNSKLMKDPTALEKAFGRVEAYRAFIQLHENREELQKMSDAGQDAGSIQRDLDTYMQSAAGRTAKAMEHLKNTIAEAFTPERIEKFAAVLEKVTDGLATTFGAFEHFFGGPTKEQGAGEAARDFVAQANPETGESAESNDAAVRRAKRVLEAKNDEDLRVSEQDEFTRTGHLGFTAGKTQTDIQRYGGLEGYKAGAKTFLESQGGADKSYLDSNDQGNVIKRFVSNAKPLTANDIATAVASALKSVNLQVLIDGKPIATAVKNSPVHRHGVAK